MKSTVVRQPLFGVQLVTAATLWVESQLQILSIRIVSLTVAAAMKLSLKFQDDPLLENRRTQILTAKLPITIFNQPFVSGLSATTINSTSDVSFSVSTSFASGPSLKLSYSPTSSSSSSPFSLFLKSGLGLFGSPRNSPLVFSAQFSLSSTNALVPAFSLHFKPQFGHFSLHKSVFSNPNIDQSSGYLTNGRANLDSGSRNDAHSEFTNGIASGSSVWQEVKLEPFAGKDELRNSKQKENFEVHSDVGMGNVPDTLLVSTNRKYGFLSGVAVMARTMMPVGKRVILNLRWGVNLPADVGWKLPYLTVNKIGIERVEEAKEVKQEKEKKKKNVDVSDANLELWKGMYLCMTRDMEVLEKENVEMKKSLEELMKIPATNHRGESNGIGKKVVQHTDGRSGDSEWSRGTMNVREENGQKEAVKSSTSRMSDVESELQKAIKAASSY